MRPGGKRLLKGSGSGVDLTRRPASFSFRVTGQGSGQGKFHLESQSSAQARPLTVGGLRAERVILPNFKSKLYKRRPSSEEFKVKEKAAHSAWRARLCPSHASHLREKLMTLTSAHPQARARTAAGDGPRGPPRRRAA